MLARVSPPTEVYRTGNDLRSLLTQRSENIISSTVPPPVLAQQPDYGLPGLKAEIQKQVLYWVLCVCVCALPVCVCALPVCVCVLCLCVCVCVLCLRVCASKCLCLCICVSRCALCICVSGCACVCGCARLGLFGDTCTGHCHSTTPFIICRWFLIGAHSGGSLGLWTRPTLEAYLQMSSRQS